MFDFKGAIIQERFASNLESPEALFAAFPDLVPCSTNFFEPVTSSWATGKSLECHYKITNMEHLRSLPLWKWDTIYQIPDIIEHGVEGAIQRSLETGGVLRGTESLLIPEGPPGLPVAVTLQHSGRG